MITDHAYWMDRDSRYRLVWTEEIQRNGRKTIDTVNQLLSLAELDGIVADDVASGWRPKSVNDATSNAAKGSRHLTAEACDLRDTDRVLAQWCLNHLDALGRLGLWMEDPRWTPTWVHLQTLPPKSGKRVYIPSTKQPLCAALVGQKPLPMTVRV